MNPVFRFHAKDAHGLDKDGEIMASDEKDAIKKLQEQDLVVISIDLVGSIEKGEIPNKSEIKDLNLGKTKKIFAITLLIVICFLGVVYFCQIQIKRAEYEKKLLEVSYGVMLNTQLSLTVTNGISKLWRLAIDTNLDFNMEIQKFLLNFEESEEGKKLENINKEIEIGMKMLKNYPKQYQEAYNTLLELYGIYSQIYSLARSPSGSLMSFNSKCNDLSSEFIKIVSKLKIYLPQLEKKNAGSLLKLMEKIK